ncbi:MAG: AraC family transcriptional regulator [Treponema sp.]|nr:AraC family transcriptional regulator [Treponema sp.]
MIFSFYFLYINSYVNTINIKSIDKFNQVKNEIDLIIKDFAFYASVVSGQVGEAREKDLYRSDELVKAMAYCWENIRNAKATFFYQRGSRFIYFAEEAVPYHLFEQMVYDAVEMTMKRVFSSLNNDRVPKKICLAAGGNNTTIFTYPVPLLDISPQATMGFLLNWDDLRLVFDNYLGNYDYSVMILDEENRPVYFSDTALFSGKDIYGKLVQLKGTGIFRYDVTGKDQITLRLISEDSRLNYFFVMDRNDFYREIGTMRTILSLLAMAMVILGLFFSATAAYRNYRPVKRLMDKLISGGNYPGRNKDEFGALEEVFDEYRSRNKSLESDLARQDLIMKHHALVRLISGAYQDGKGTAAGEGQDMMPGIMSFSFKHEYFLMLFVYIPEKSARVRRPGADQNTGKAGYQPKILYNLQTEEYEVYLFKLEREESYAALVNTAYGATAGLASLEEGGGRDIALRVLEFVRANVSPGALVGMGGFSSSPLGCESSFMQSYAAIRERSLEVLPGIYAFKPSPEDETPSYPEKELSLYLHALKTGDAGQALAFLARLLEKAEANTNSSLNPRFYASDIANSVLKTLVKNNLPWDSAAFKDLWNFSSFPVFKEKITRLTGTLCEGIVGSRRNSKRQTAREIRDFIDANCNRPDFSLLMTAEKFNLSVSYLSNFFKEELGTGFNKYVSNLRLSEAKRLLISTNLPVKDIVKRIGYSDIPSFIKKFRQAEGMSPGKFRETKQDAGHG